MISKNFTRPLALLIFEGTLVYLCGVMAIYIRLGAETPYALGATNDGRNDPLALRRVHGEYDLARFIKNTSGFARAQWR